MAGTFSQIYIQVVFAVKGRQSLINQVWEEDLYKYISGIVRNKEQKMLAINGMPDHIHMLIGMRPSCCLSDLVREVKKSSTNYVRNNLTLQHDFNWQEGYGAFSYSQSSLDNVIQYIGNQKVHHKRQNFRDEYVSFLNQFNIEYKNEFLFDFNNL
jgi:putative transposase